MDTNNIDVVRAIVKAARPSDAKRAPPRKPRKPPPALQRAAALVQGVDACESALKRCARAYAMPDDDAAMTDAAATPSTRASGRCCGNAKLLWTNRLLIMENRGRAKRTPGAASRSRGRARRRWLRCSGTSRFEAAPRSRGVGAARDPRGGRRRRGAPHVERGRGAPSDARPAHRRRRAAKAEAEAGRCEAGRDAAAGAAARASARRTNCSGSRPSSRPSSRACPTPRGPSRRGPRTCRASRRSSPPSSDEQHDQVVTLDGLVGDTANQVDKAGDHVAQAASRRATLPRVFNAVVLSLAALLLLIHAVHS